MPLIRRPAPSRRLPRAARLALVAAPFLLLIYIATRRPPEVLGDPPAPVAARRLAADPPPHRPDSADVSSPALRKALPPPLRRPAVAPPAADVSNVAAKPADSAKTPSIPAAELVAPVAQLARPVAERDSSSDAVVRAEPKSASRRCAKYIMYDKPVKTGSTAISKALRSMLAERGIKAEICTRDECTAEAKAICAGKVPPRPLFGHLYGEHGLLECLKRKGYYAATSVRAPLPRWESAFLFNQRKRSHHYGIPWQDGYAKFMQQFPACTLLEYYDGLSPRCRGRNSTEERVKHIVNRYDEVIDLYDSDEKSMGQLHRILQKYLKKENLSPPDNDDFREPFDRSRMANETVLYEALKMRRKELQRVEPRPLC